MIGRAGRSGHHVRYRAASENERALEVVLHPKVMFGEINAMDRILNMKHAKCQHVIVRI